MEVRCGALLLSLDKLTGGFKEALELDASIRTLSDMLCGVLLIT